MLPFIVELKLGLTNADFFFVFTALKKKRDRLESEMEQLGSVRELQMKESEATEKKTGLERKIHYLTIEEVIKIKFYIFLAIILNRRRGFLVECFITASSILVLYKFSAAFAQCAHVLHEIFEPPFLFLRHLCQIL